MENQDKFSQFNNNWEEFFEEWKNDKNGIPYYICLGDFAHYLINKIENSETDDFPKIFDVIEKLHIEGDSYVREAITVGLLESIQNIAGNKANLFIQFLLPETNRWWNKLNQFWDEGKLLN